MRKLIIAIGLSLALAACGSIKNPLSKSQLDPIESSFGIGYTLLAEYRDLCEARKIANSCRVAVPKLQFAATEAQGSLIVARDLVDNHPEIDATTAIDTARKVVKSFRSILTNNGVK